MFHHRSLARTTYQFKAINQGLSGLAYQTKRLLLVLIMSLLSFTQLPEMFAQEVMQQASAVTATIKKQRVINLYKSKAGLGSTTSTTKNVSSNSRQKSLSGVVATGTLLFNGTGSCVWDMTTMQWTGLQIMSGSQWKDIMTSSQRSGVWSGFDIKTMILSYHTGVIMDNSLVLGDQYLAFTRCSWSSGIIVYPGEQEYLSGLVSISGSLSLLPPVFTGVVFQLQENIYGSADDLFLSQASTGLHGGFIKQQETSIQFSSVSNDGDFVIVTSPLEFKSTIDRGVMSLEKQKIIRSRNSGGYNKITTSKRMRYLYQNNKIKADLQAATTIFTAEGQDIAIDNVVLQEVDPRPLYKRKDPLTQGSNLATTIEFGTPGDHLIFTQPIMITYQSDLPDGSPVWLQVQHAGQNWSTQGLSLDPNTQCDLEGNASLPGSKTSVQGGQIQFYTCGASTFSLVYTGGASAPNYIDNSTRDFTGVVITGVNFPTGSVIADANILIDFRPIDNESPTGPWGTTNCYPTEKSFQLIHPDGTIINLANAGTYTAPNTTCPQAQILYDQQATGPIVGGVWNLTGQSRQPVASLNTLNGKSPFGTWTLRMGDNAGADGVILYGFNLQLRNIECGDGLIETGEVCDDSNAANGDGCSLSCQVESGRQCSGQPSSCSLIPAPSGLRFHLDGSMTGALFRDIAGSGFDATSFNGVTTGNQNGEVTMCFNGTTQYLERATNFATAYPFTMSTWMKSNTIVGLHGVMSYARSTAANIMYNIEHNATTIRQSAQNTTANYANASTALTTTDWFLVTAVYTSATSRTIYVNGVQVGTNVTSVPYDTNVTKRINIGRLADSTPTNYFAGCVDDVRFYTTELTSGQVYSLYAKPAGLTTSLVTVGSPLLTGTIQGTLDTIRLTISGTNYTGTNHGNGTWSLPGGTISPALVNGTYVTTMLVTNPYGRAVTYTGSFVVSIPPAPTGTLCIESPDILSMTGVQGTSGGIWEAQFDYFQVQDTKGINSGYYTTLSLTDLVGPGGEIFPMNNIQRKGDTITTLSGTANARVVLGSTLSGVYAPATGTVTFLKRDTAPNGGLIGTYGSQLRLQYSIPTYQRIGTYTGTITYTLYEN